MVSALVLGVLLASQCPPQGTVIVPPDVASRGYGFVMEVAGSSIDSVLAQPEDESVERALPEGDAIRITLDRVVGNAGGPECNPLRIVITASVDIRSGGCWRQSRATILLGARLNVVSGADGALALEIAPVPDALIVTSDADKADEVEQLITATGPQLAEKLRLSIPLEGLTTLARARPKGSPDLQATAYPLGFAWVLQVSGPTVPEPPCVFRVFLQGDVFTLVLSKETIAGVADYECRLGNLPKRMNAEGLIDANGAVRVERVGADIEPDTLVIDWHGVGPDSSEVAIRWRMGFDTTADGLALRIREITVDGQSKPVPEEAVNPFHELIRSIATGPKRTGLLVSPMGRMRLTTGVITGDAILVAGRV